LDEVHKRKEPRLSETSPSHIDDVLDLREREMDPCASRSEKKRVSPCIDRYRWSPFRRNSGGISLLLQRRNDKRVSLLLVIILLDVIHSRCLLWIHAHSMMFIRHWGL
jgi:hypothetical protein